MNAETENETTGQELILFIAGDAPRSQRARANLAAALGRAVQDTPRLREIDVLCEPVAAIEHGIFATPALVRPQSHGASAVLYGDLSDASGLNRFLNTGTE